MIEYSWTLISPASNLLCTLVTGLTVRVKFTYGNTVASPTLSINGSTAKRIKRYGTTDVSTTGYTSWPNGSIVSFTYDGTNWIVDNFRNIRTVRANTASSAISNNYELNFCSGNNVKVTSAADSTNLRQNLTFSIPSTTAPEYTIQQVRPGLDWTNPSILATRWGNVVQIVLRLEGLGLLLSAGTDGYDGTVTCTAGYMPARPVTLIGYTGATVLMGWLEKTSDTTASLTVRASTDTRVPSGSGLWLTGTFITDTNTTG